MRHICLATVLLALLSQACLIPRESVPTVDELGPRDLSAWRIAFAKGLLHFRVPPGYMPWTDSRFIVRYDSSERTLRGTGCRAILISQGDNPVLNALVNSSRDMRVYLDHDETISDELVRVIVVFDGSGRISVPHGYACNSYVVSGTWKSRDLVFTATTRDMSELTFLLASLRSVELDDDPDHALQ